MDDQDVYDSIGAVCIDCGLPYDLCDCPLDYVDKDECCPTPRALDLAGLCVCNPFFIGIGTCVRCGGRYHPPSQ